MKSSLLLSFLLISVVTANKKHYAPPNITTGFNDSVLVLKFPSTSSPFKKWIHIIEMKTPAPATKKLNLLQPLPKWNLPLKSILGTPHWDNYIRKFQKNIAANSSRVQETNAIAEKRPLSRSQAQSSSESTHGPDFKVEVVGNNGVTKITFSSNNYYRILKFEIAGRVITISDEHNGQQTIVKLEIPDGVDLQKVNVTKEGQAIVITTPAAEWKMSMTRVGFNDRRPI